MDNNLFESNKIEDIEIPKELNNLMKDSIKKGEEKLRRKNRINNFINTSILVFVLIVTLSLNTSATFATFASDLPIVGKIAESMVFDKGIKNAIENGLYQKIGYSETKNGITLKVPSIAGDYRCLKVEYLLEGIERNDIRTDIVDLNGNHIGFASSFFKTSIDGSEDLNSCFEFMFEDFVKEFIVIFKIYDNQESTTSLAEFEVKIVLEDKFTDTIEKIEINNKIIETEVGDLIINDINATKTRTYIEMVFESEEYELMGFEKLVLVDENGLEHDLRTSFGENIFSVEGDLSRAKSITLKADALYYLSKNDRTLKIDLKNREIYKNNYDVNILSNEKIDKLGLYTNLESNNIVIEAKGTSGFRLKSSEDIIFIRSNMISKDISKLIEEYIRGSITYVLYENLTDKDEIEVEIESIYSNIIKDIEAKIK